MKRLRQGERNRSGLSLKGRPARRRISWSFVTETLEHRALLASSLTGLIYDDVNTNGIYDPGVDTGIAGVLVTINGPGGARAVTSTADGSYKFEGLAPGTYELNQTQPAGYSQGSANVPPGGGTISGNDRIVNIPVPDNVELAGYNFGDRAIRVTGSAYLDRNRNGTRDAGEPGVAGATLVMRNSLGGEFGTTTSDADGNYTFSVVPTGDYTLNVTAPAGYGTSTPTSQNVTVGASGASGRNFGLTLGSLAGIAYVDANGNGVQDNSEPGLSGVYVTLQGTDAGGQAVNRTIVTGVNGLYTFDDVLSGSYNLTRSVPTGYTGGTITPGTGGGTASANGVTGINLNVGVQASGYAFAFAGTGIGGLTFIDENSNGQLDPTEKGLGGVLITLKDSKGAIVSTTTTAADGTYIFNPPVGTYTIEQTQPLGYRSSTPNTRTVTLTATGAPNQLFGETTGSLSGSVFVDANNNRIRDAGELGIPGTTVTLVGRTEANTDVSYTLTTDANGNYTFANLLAGNYTLTETQPEGYTDGLDNVGTAGGVLNENDKAKNIAITPGVAATGYIFGERGATISGVVYLDKDGSGSRDPGEPGQAGVVLTIKDSANKVLGTATTLSDGTYSFANLKAGTYTVQQTQPAGYVSSTPDSVTLTITEAGQGGVDFGEKGGLLSGSVYADLNNNGVRDAGEPGIPGVPISLRRGDGLGVEVDSTTTDANGNYTFSALLGGQIYRIVETGPSTYDDGQDAVGTAGGTLFSSDDIRNITLGAGQVGTGYTFGERPRGLSGLVFIDLNNNGIPEQGELGIPGTVLRLVRNSDGVTVGTATTDSQGQYVFPRSLYGAFPGEYTLVETQPAGFLDSPTSPNSRTITLPASADDGTRQEFAEIGGSIAGSVYVDLDDDGVRDPEDPGIAGISLRLTGTDVTGAFVDRTVTTDANGNYTFANLAASNGSGYSISETQPTNRRQGKDTIGNLGGTVTAPNVMSGIVLPAGGQGTGYNFGEINSSVSGRVFVDKDGDGVFDDGEVGLAGVPLALVDANNRTVATATSATDGTYTFSNVDPGSYSIVRTLPVGYGSSTANTRSVLVADTNITGQDFGQTTGTLAGKVYLDVNNNGIPDGNERGIGGVTLTLTGTDANGNPVTITTTTGVDGTYTFTGLIAGTYALQETQPPNFEPGQAAAGTAGGTVVDGNTVNNIGLGAAIGSTGYFFGERALVGASISGSVYVDENGNGVRDPGEPGIPGVTIVLEGIDQTNAVVQRTVTTDSNGNYTFDGLPQGVYAITEQQPAGFDDGPESVGTAGGLIDSGNRIRNIALSANQAATGYNFGELRFSGSLSGFSYVDHPRNNRRNGRDYGVKDVMVRLVGTDSFGNHVERYTLTNKDGYYTFAGLPAGTYLITQAQPGSLRPGSTQVGTQGGVVIRVNSIGGIVLEAGESGQQNNFGNLLKSGTRYGRFITRRTDQPPYVPPRNQVRPDITPPNRQVPNGVPPGLILRRPFTPPHRRQG